MILQEFHFLEKPVTAQRGDSLSLSFPFLTADEENKNKRIYPFAVVKKAVAEAGKRLSGGRALFGSSTHRDRLEIDDVSHMIEKVFLVGKIAHCEAKILPTQKGKNLMTILRGGGRLGVSARGFGSVASQKNGVSIIAPDYQLEGIDFVMSPSFDTFAGMTKESLFEGLSLEYGTLREADLKARYGQAVRIGGFRGTFGEYLKAWRTK